MSALRARCPHCRTLTAVAFDDVYECHSCGAEFGAGLVRVPRAWGTGGEEMAEAAHTVLPYPEALVVARDTLEEQSAATALGLPRRPLVLGGCCCAHIGAIRGLAARYERLAVVWLDAHGDLNTPASSPSGNLWGMPLRMAIDEGASRRRASRSSAPGTSTRPSRSTSRGTGSTTTSCGPSTVRPRRTSRSTSTCFEPGPVPSFMPVPGGPSPEDAERLLFEVTSRTTVAGLGLTGLAPGAPTDVLARFAAAAGL